MMYVPVSADAIPAIIKSNITIKNTFFNICFYSPNFVDCINEYRSKSQFTTAL